MDMVDIRQIPLFAPLSTRDLASLAARAISEEYARGARLRINAGRADITIVQAGVVRLFRRHEGAEVTVGIAQAGSVLRFADVAVHVPNEVEAEALTFVRTVTVPVATLLTIGARDPQILADLAASIISRIDDAYATAGASTQAATRILRSLQILTRPKSTGTGGDDEVICRLTVRLSHGELARIVNADRATVTRSLNELATQGLIRKESGHIVGVRVRGVEERAG